MGYSKKTQWTQKAETDFFMMSCGKKQVYYKREREILFDY